MTLKNLKSTVSEVVIVRCGKHVHLVPLPLLVVSSSPPKPHRVPPLIPRHILRLTVFLEIFHILQIIVQNDLSRHSAPVICIPSSAQRRRGALLRIEVHLPPLPRLLQQLRGSQMCQGLLLRQFLGDQRRDQVLLSYLRCHVNPDRVFGFSGRVDEFFFVPNRTSRTFEGHRLGVNAGAFRGRFVRHRWRNFWRILVCDLAR